MNITIRLATAVCFAAALTACAKTDDSAADTATIDTAPGAILPAPAPATETSEAPAPRRSTR